MGPFGLEAAEGDSEIRACVSGLYSTLSVLGVVLLSALQIVAQIIHPTVVTDKETEAQQG